MMNGLNRSRDDIVSDLHAAEAKHDFSEIEKLEKELARLDEERNTDTTEVDMDISRSKGTLQQKIDIQALKSKLEHMDTKKEQEKKFLLHLEEIVSSKINRKELVEIAKQALENGNIILNDKGEIENIVIDKEGKKVDSALFGLARDRFGKQPAIVYWLQTRSSNFKNRFGDWQNDPKNASKVVDKNGEPRMVFHGGKRRFDEFKTGLNSQGGGSFGVFATSHKEIAESYANEKGDNDVNVEEPTLYSLFVVIKKPIIFQNKSELEDKVRELGGGGLNDREALKKAAASLKSTYDGLYIKELDGYDQIMVIDTKNLKSVENVGTFSTNEAKLAA